MVLGVTTKDGSAKLQKQWEKSASAPKGMWGYTAKGQVYQNGSVSSGGGALADGDVLRISVSPSGELRFEKISGASSPKSRLVPCSAHSYAKIQSRVTLSLR